MNEFATRPKRPADQSSALRRTFYENLADMGGIKISKMAFDEYSRVWNISNKIGLPGLNDTTQDQVFFIAFGQAWCTKKLSRAQQLQLDQDRVLKILKCRNSCCISLYRTFSDKMTRC